jgi:hypothetical protein
VDGHCLPMISQPILPRSSLDSLDGINRLCMGALLVTDGDRGVPSASTASRISIYDADIELGICCYI